MEINNKNNDRTLWKLRIQVQISLDGCIAGPNYEMDWIVWDDGYIKYINQISESINTIIMERKMVDGFILYWTPGMNKSEDLMKE